jgi:putative phage-type endonuclease
MGFLRKKVDYLYYANYKMQQGSSEWREWRKGVIGASDAPTIMGENPFSSIEYLASEKMGLRPEFKGNAATREGNRLEGDARRWLEKEYKLKLKPTILQDGSTPYLAASLDAIDEDHSQVFEIKCGLKSYELAEKKSEIPDYYYGQLQHILMVTRLPMITYVAYRPDSDLILMEVERDTSYISKLRYAEESFAATLKGRGHRMQNSFVGTPFN